MPKYMPQHPMIEYPRLTRFCFPPRLWEIKSEVWKDKKTIFAQDYAIHDVRPCEFRLHCYYPYTHVITENPPVYVYRERRILESLRTSVVFVYSPSTADEHSIRWMSQQWQIPSPHYDTWHLYPDLSFSRILVVFAVLGTRLTAPVTTCVTFQSSTILLLGSQ